MIQRALVSLPLSALMIGGTVVGCAAGGDHVASASAAVPQAQAGVEHDRAVKALAHGNADEAVRFAEQAVAASPRQVRYRMLLGQSYLKAGRFVSARQAFADVLQLDPDNGKAALNLALAQTGLGDWAGARAMLDAHAATIPAADRGLATALAGDPVGAVEQLTVAARSSGADVKTRQNLALALALAGHWPEAKAVAAVDLSPADVDKRMAQWATFARPSGAADQVSALLGVVPVVDAGQPAVLALAAPAPIQPPAAEATTPPVTIQPVVDTAPEPSAAAVASAPEPVPPAAAHQPPTEAVAATPLRVLVPAGSSVRMRALQASQSAALHPAGGSWLVQIGAFRNAAVARDGWLHAVRRDAALNRFVPQGSAIKVDVRQFYRLSVGGFSRADAVAMCRRYHARGGACFVRVNAGDQVAQWQRKNSQLALR